MVLKLDWDNENNHLIIMQLKFTIANTHLYNIQYNAIVSFQVIVKNIIDPDDNSKRSSKELIWFKTAVSPYQFISKSSPVYKLL